MAECSPTGSWRGPSRSVGFLESCSQPSTTSIPTSCRPWRRVTARSHHELGWHCWGRQPQRCPGNHSPCSPTGTHGVPCVAFGDTAAPHSARNPPCGASPPLPPAPFGAHGVQGVPRPHPQRGMKGGFGGRRAFREHHLRSEGSLWSVRSRGDGSRDADRALLLARQWAARVLQRCGEEEGETRTRSGRARGWRCARPPGSTASERRWHEGGRRLKQPLMKPEINRAASRRAALYLQEDDGAEAARRPRPRPASDGAVRGVGSARPPSVPAPSPALLSGSRAAPYRHH